jgi:hypothetical protein
MPTKDRGNTLLYILVLLVIFSVLGITMVSLFTTSVTSSATPNDARRAYYMAESGVRYALSRIRNANFHQDFIEEINNTPQYTLDNGSSFKIEIFSPWFISPTGQRVADNNIFTLSVPNSGIIPDDPEYPVDSNEFPIPFGSNFFLVDCQNFRGNGGIYPPDSYAEITGATATLGSTSLTITLEGTHGLDVDAGDTVCLAVQPTDADASLTVGESIYITRSEETKRFFPSRHGAIRIVTSDNQIGDYYYDTLVDESTKLELTNLKSMPGTDFINITDFSTDDRVVLSRYNYRVITTGTSGDVTTEIGDN